MAVKGQKYHISKNGEPGVCFADRGTCPLGGEHFNDKHEAQAYSEFLHSQSFGSVATLRKPKKKSALGSSETTENKSKNSIPLKPVERPRNPLDFARRTPRITTNDLPPASKVNSASVMDQERYLAYADEFTRETDSFIAYKLKDTIEKISRRESFDEINESINNFNKTVDSSKKYSRRMVNYPEISVKKVNGEPEVTIVADAKTNKQITFMASKSSAEKEASTKFTKASEINKKVSILENKLKNVQEKSKERGTTIDPEVLAETQSRINEGKQKAELLRREAEELMKFERETRQFNRAMEEIDNSKIDEDALNLFNESKATTY